MAKKDKVLETRQENYHFAKKAVDDRKPDWDEKDDLYLGHIDKTKTISRAKVTDSVPFRLIMERVGRVFANKPRGHYSPEEGGDVIGAKVFDALGEYYWGRANHGGSMTYKWWMNVFGAAKYGTAFFLVPYWYERKIIREKNGKDLDYRKIVAYDGPEMKPLNIRDCFPDPTATNIRDCKWFQVREFMSLKQLEAINNSNPTDPKFKNLQKLKDSFDEEFKGGERRLDDQARSKTVRGLEDYTGQDENNPVFEIITEYSNERVYKFSDQHSVVLQDDPNPLFTGDIPIGSVVQYPLEDDMYGLGELEPVKRLLRASSALVNQALDETNMKLYSPLKIDPTKVETSTIKWTPGAKWIVSDMNAIQEHVVQSKFVQHFVPTYSFMLSAIQNASGTTDITQNNSQTRSLGETATGTRFIAKQQNARDNMFLTFIEDAIKFQMDIWRQWIQQNLDKPKLVKVAGQELMEFFEEKFPETVEGEDGMEQNSEAFVDIDGESKLKYEDNGEAGFLTATPEDIVGGYDYIPEVGSTQEFDPAIERNNLLALFNLLKDPATAAALAAEGQRLKVSEMSKELFHKFDIKNPDRFFEDVEEAEPQGQVGPDGQPLPPGQGQGLPPGVAGPPGQVGPPQPPTPNQPGGKIG